MTRTLVLLAAVATACSGSPSGAACEPGTEAGCACPDGTIGLQHCLDDGTYAECRCQGAIGDAGPLTDGGGPDAGGCILVEEEWCDGQDNDCDGAVDEEEACEDLTVANTDPFLGTVYLLGTLAEGACGADVIQRFYPSLSGAYTSGFECTVDWIQYRRIDGKLFYADTGEIRRWDPAWPHTVLPTPPCDGNAAAARFAFDAAKIMYYQCPEAADNGYRSLRRSGGDVVAFGASLVTVLPDSRIIALVSGDDGTDYVVLAPDGAELARLSPHADFTGEMIPNPKGTTTDGNRAYVLYNRFYGQNQEELVAFRLTESSEWQRMRRAPVETLEPAAAKFHLLLSDGTILVRGQEPETGEDRIMALRPDGAVEAVWREAEQTEVRAHGGSLLLLGPP